MKRMTQNNESILDQPVPNMCKDVWDISDPKNPILKPEAEEKIQRIVDWAVDRFDIINHTVNITGSITSN